MLNWEPSDFGLSLEIGLLFVSVACPDEQSIFGGEAKRKEKIDNTLPWKSPKCTSDKALQSFSEKNPHLVHSIPPKYFNFHPQTKGF